MQWVRFYWNHLYQIWGPYYRSLPRFHHLETRFARGNRDAICVAMGKWVRQSTICSLATSQGPGVRGNDEVC
ncbi:hypothetical protein Poly24_43520 [Rosistilla carotiformis]|uniref:Uncharacterized protein n=1 Tax=Rosistilla carotiformis TaxID=2528017 RepID=A0A518JYK7_9BACT|nr:hypothetical protein Poly24_43520 [Rosistilla carotiformis]